MTLSSFNTNICTRCGKHSCLCCAQVPWPCWPQGPTGPTGPTGPAGGATGPTGPAGATAATIPFSISTQSGTGVEISTDEAGNPGIINFAGFGAPGYDRISLQPGEWATGTITIRDSTPYPASFVMPRDAVLQNINIIFANRSPMPIDIGTTMRPFVCIAVSNNNDLMFTVLQNTITYTEPYIGTGDENYIPKYSLRRGSLTGINTAIPAGTLVGIVMGWVGEGTAPEQYGMFSISGGIYME